MMESSHITQNLPRGVTKKGTFFSGQQWNKAGEFFFQPKLSVGPTDDIYEREADAVADKVMRMGSDEQIQTKISPVSIQRKCSTGEEEQLQRKEDEINGEQSELSASDTIEFAGNPDGESARGKLLPPVQRKCAACEEDEDLQRKENDANDEQSEAPSIVSDALGSGGSSLDNNSRVFMENRFGYDFGGVKIHTDSLAAKSAKSINALAYTSGNNIVFGSGQYSTQSDRGKRLLAHELTHVVQQRHAPALAIQRHDDDDDSGFHRVDELPELPPPVACSGGSNDPCQLSHCTGRHAGISADFTRALNYASAACQALEVNPLSESTIQALDWYFNDHSEAMASTVLETMRCIMQCLADASANHQYGCHLDEPHLAYVCVESTPVCTDSVTDVCLTERYFGEGDRSRAETLIHECSHRMGLSLGGPDFDVYDFREHFLRLSTSEALMNADSFALFAGAITNGVRASVLFVGSLPFGVSLGGGAVLSGGTETWYARLNITSVEFQHPILQFINPFLGVSFTVIGESTSRTGLSRTASVSFLASLIAGFRIGDPRPGPDGGGYLSFWGGPAVAFRDFTRELGAEAGVAMGYRWNWFDASIGGSYVYDPTRPEGMRDLMTVGASLSLTFEPQIIAIP